MLGLNPFFLEVTAEHRMRELEGSMRRIRSSSFDAGSSPVVRFGFRRVVGTRLISFGERLAGRGDTVCQAC